MLAPRSPRPDRREPPALVGHELGGLLVVPGGLAQRLDRAEHVVERVGVDGQHLGSAAEVGQGIVHDRDVDRADGAQVLGDDEVGVQPGQRSLVEVVEVVATPHRLHHEGVDLGGRQPFGHRARRDDATGAGLLRVVALERHAHHVVTRPDREEDLRRRREERDDAHGSFCSMVEVRGPPGPSLETSESDRWVSRLVAGAPRTSTDEDVLVDDPTYSVLALLALAGLAAGFVDAVVGGGGLIQLPALLLGLPNAAPVQLLATDKLRLDLRHHGEQRDVLPAGRATARPSCR